VRSVSALVNVLADGALFPNWRLVDETIAAGTGVTFPVLKIFAACEFVAAVNSDFFEFRANVPIALVNV